MSTVNWAGAADFRWGQYAAADLEGYRRRTAAVEREGMRSVTEKTFLIDHIPAVLYGEPSQNIYLFVNNGKRISSHYHILYILIDIRHFPTK